MMNEFQQDSLEEHQKPAEKNQIDSSDSKEKLEISPEIAIVGSSDPYQAQDPNLDNNKREVDDHVDDQDNDEEIEDAERDSPEIAQAAEEFYPSNFDYTSSTDDEEEFDQPLNYWLYRGRPRLRDHRKITHMALLPKEKVKLLQKSWMDDSRQRWDGQIINDDQEIKDWIFDHRQDLQSSSATIRLPPISLSKGFVNQKQTGYFNGF